MCTPACDPVGGTCVISNLTGVRSCQCNLGYNGTTCNATVVGADFYTVDAAATGKPTIELDPSAACAGGTTYYAAVVPRQAQRLANPYGFQWRDLNNKRVVSTVRVELYHDQSTGATGPRTVYLNDVAIPGLAPIILQKPDPCVGVAQLASYNPGNANTFTIDNGSKTNNALEGFPGQPTIVGRVTVLYA